MTANYDSFGRVERHIRRIVSPDAAIDGLRRQENLGKPLLAYGNGLSYGDTCHNDAGALLPMRAHHATLGFDPLTGIVTAQSGATLEELIVHAAPHGYFLPVTPGTRFVTLGGAIANDVHGKNHHRRGTFGSHVTGFELLRSDGNVYACSPHENVDLFNASIGGMGLTGVILSASIRLMRVGSLDVNESIVPFRSVEEYFELAEAADAANEYAVAWIDQLATPTRGVLITGNHAENGNFPAVRTAPRLSVPFELPFSMLNNVSLRAFNFAYFHAKARKIAPHVSSYGSFFYPLDGIGSWNRLYGPAGLYQHQSVIPFATARRAIPQMIEASRRARQASFLTVLKRFGAVCSPGMLSFPRPGYTLTMDFSNGGAATLSLLQTLDQLTVEAGGRVNPYKDQRMSAATFAAGFPEWEMLERLRDPSFSSNFWQRTALSLRQHMPSLAAE